MNHSDKLDQIGAAMLAVQSAVSGVEKSSNNPHFKSKYADLASTNAATREHLIAAGIVVTQWPGRYEGDARTMEMTTMLLHAASGQWMRETLSIPLAKVDAQGYGSCNTYARRYALQAALNLSPEDDDGNAAARPSASSAKPATIGDAQVAELQTLISQTGTDIVAVCKNYGVAAIPELSVNDHAHLVGILKKRLVKEAA